MGKACCMLHSGAHLMTCGCLSVVEMLIVERLGDVVFASRRQWHSSR